MRAFPLRPSAGGERVRCRERREEEEEGAVG